LLCLRPLLPSRTLGKLR